MGVSEILAAIDREIAQLEQVRTLLGGNAPLAPKRGPGRPKKSAVAAVPATKPAKKKRKISPEGRNRIIEAVKKRWAEKKKAVAGK